MQKQLKNVSIQKKLIQEIYDEKIKNNANKRKIKQITLSIKKYDEEHNIHKETLPNSSIIHFYLYDVRYQILFNQCAIVPIA